MSERPPGSRPPHQPEMDWDAVRAEIAAVVGERGAAIVEEVRRENNSKKERAREKLKMMSGTGAEPTEAEVEEAVGEEIMEESSPWEGLDAARLAEEDLKIWEDLKTDEGVFANRFNDWRREASLALTIPGTAEAPVRTSRNLLVTFVSGLIETRGERPELKTYHFREGAV